MRQPWTLDRVVRLVITLVCVAAGLWLIDVLRHVLLPFLVACLIAYMLEPAVQFNRRLLHLRGRVGAVLITLSETALIVGVLGYFFVPSIIAEMHQMAQMLREFAASDPADTYLPAGLSDLLRRNIDFEKLADHLLRQDMQSIVDRAMALLQGSLSMIITVLSWLVVVLYVVFIMLDYERLMRGFHVMVPPKARPVTYKIARDIKASMNHYFRGQALIALILGAIYSAGFLICGLPLAVVMGMLTGLLFMIPYCQLLSIIPVTLLCLVETAHGGAPFWPHWWECMAVFAVAQICADLVLTPRIMGRAMGLNPALILLSLSIWGTLFGFVGFIIALPLTTLVLSYYEQYVIMRDPNETLSQRRREVTEIRHMDPEK